MKITLISLAALILAPIALQASDKEVSRAHTCGARNHQQVALFVSGRGIGDQPAPPTSTISQAQTGQGGSITFFTGN